MAGVVLRRAGPRTWRAPRSRVCAIARACLLLCARLSFLWFSLVNLRNEIHLLWYKCCTMIRNYVTASGVLPKLTNEDKPGPGSERERAREEERKQCEE
eukprot:3616505-Rhodomonas_salina.2